MRHVTIGDRTGKPLIFFLLSPLFSFCFPPPSSPFCPVFGRDRNTLDYNAVDRGSRPTRNIMKFSFFIIYYIYYVLSPHVTTPASYLVHKDYNHGSHLRKMKTRWHHWISPLGTPPFACLCNLLRDTPLYTPLGLFSPFIVCSYKMSFYMIWCILMYYPKGLQSIFIQIISSTFSSLADSEQIHLF